MCTLSSTLQSNLDCGYIKKAGKPEYANHEITVDAQHLKKVRALSSGRLRSTLSYADVQAKRYRALIGLQLMFTISIPMKLVEVLLSVVLLSKHQGYKNFVCLS